MKTLIVSKTVMGGAFCVGGWTIDNQSVRLLLPGANCHPPDTPFVVGDVWDLEFIPREDVIPPHIEDVIVTRRERLGPPKRELREVLLQRVPIWRGGPEEMYEGVLGWSQNGSGYVSERRGLPDMSTGFWMPDAALEYERPYYHYAGSSSRFQTRRLKYVGTEPPLPRIPAGTLVRVSLARWWHPDDDPSMESRCYLQLSGWYQ
jgi:hypothetical protein